MKINFLTPGNLKIFAGIFLLFFLFLSTILLISNLNKPQDIRQRASQYSLTNLVPVTMNFSVKFDGLENFPNTKDITVCFYHQQINPQMDLNCTVASDKQDISLSLDKATNTYVSQKSIQAPLGNYFLTISALGYARRTLSQPVSIINSSTIVSVPQTSLIAGDIYRDGYINIVDYNILVHCLGANINSSQCAPYKNTLDLNGDGVVDLVDLNVFLRNLALQASGNY